jgi:hypothetical protein
MKKEQSIYCPLINRLYVHSDEHLKRKEKDGKDFHRLNYVLLYPRLPILRIPPGGKIGEKRAVRAKEKFTLSLKKLLLSPVRLCRKSVHGSTGSPRTDPGTLKIKSLAVRPERVEGRTANCDTVSVRERIEVRGQGEGISGRLKSTFVCRTPRLLGEGSSVVEFTGNLK